LQQLAGSSTGVFERQCIEDVATGYFAWWLMRWLAGPVACLSLGCISLVVVGVSSVDCIFD